MNDMVNIIYDYINPAHYNYNNVIKELKQKQNQDVCYDCGLQFEYIKQYITHSYICQSCDYSFCKRCYFNYHYQKKDKYYMKYFINYEYDMFN